MPEQPPVQPPNSPPPNPPTVPMPAAASPPAGGPAASPSGPPGSPGGPAGPPPGAAAGPAPAGAPEPNVWRRATSTTGRRVALALSVAALVGLLVLGTVIGGLLALRHLDRADLVGARQDRQFLGQDGPGNGNGNGKGKGNGKLKDQGPGANGKQDRRNPAMPGMPGMPGGRDGLGGLGNRLGGASLHGAVTATVDGSVQAVVFQRGEVTAVSASSITLKSSDGFTGTYGRNASTKATGAAPVKGGQAFVLARASDKVALRTIAMPAKDS